MKPLRHPYRTELPLRALSLLQPWAFAVVTGAKTVETRSRHLGLRAGDWIAVHASKRRVARSLVREVWTGINPHLEPPAFTRGAIVGVARVLWVAEVLLEERLRPISGIAAPRSHGYLAATDQDRALGDFRPGRVIAQLTDARALYRPIPYRGQLGLHYPPPSFGLLVERELVWPVTQEDVAEYLRRQEVTP
jgi:hypothetical protein